MVLGAVAAVASVIAEVPQLVYLLVAVLVLGVIGLIKDRPSGIRMLVSSHTAIVVIAIGIIFFGSAFGWERASKLAAERNAAAELLRDQQANRKRALEAEQARKADVIRGAPAAAAKLQTEIANLRAAVELEQWSSIPSHASRVGNLARPYLGLQGLPSAMTTALVQAAQTGASVEPIIRARAAVDDAQRQITNGTAHQSRSDFVEASDAFTDASAKLFALRGESARYAPERARLLGESAAAERKVHARAQQQQKQRDREAARSARDAAKAQQASQLRTLQATACGPEPQRSPWNEVYTAVESYLEEKANDPDSVDVSRCGQALLTDNCWVTRCTYRAKNAFGALVLEARDFNIARNNTVIAVSERYQPR
jgi:hypothetical protein